MTKEALKLALEALEDACGECCNAEYNPCFQRKAITAIKKALAQPESDYERGFINGMQKQMQSSVDRAVNAMTQPEQETVAYDKTEMNCFVQDLYDKKMQEGKHGHYETMFHVVHQAIKKVPPQREFVGLTDEEIWKTISRIGTSDSDVNPYAKLADARAIETKLKQKNGYAEEKNT